MTADCDKKLIRIVAKIQMVLQALPIFLLIVLFIALLENITGNLLIGIMVVFILAIIFVINLRKNAKKTIKLISRNPEIKSNENHHAIIIAHFHSPKIDGTYELRDYMDGIDILVEKFQDTDNLVNYKIYEVESKEEAQKIICNPKVTHLWLFGHGLRNKLQFKSGDLCYFFVRKATKKEFIGQYHCNSYLGKSLADYNSPNNSDITKWPRFTPFIRLAVKRKLKELETNSSRL